MEVLDEQTTAVPTDETPPRHSARQAITFSKLTTIYRLGKKKPRIHADARRSASGRADDVRLVFCSYPRASARNAAITSCDRRFLVAAGGRAVPI